MKYSYTADPFGVHEKIVNIVPEKSKVLEIGCASGYISGKLKFKGCKVTGVELDKRSAYKARKFLEKLILGNVEEKKILVKLAQEKFDVILLMDVLEHLHDPLAILVTCRNLLKKEGIIVISVPNISFLTNRLTHLLGNFDYTKTGIMDETHLKFFTKKSILELIYMAGLKVSKFDYVGNFTQLPFYMQTLYPLIGKKEWWRNIEYRLTGFWPEGLAVQFLIVCKTK